MAWQKIGSETLSTTADTITISAATPTLFNQILLHTLESGNVDVRMRLGNTSVETGSVYADRFSFDGGADATQTSQNDIHLINVEPNVTAFSILYIINISTEEKLIVGNSMEQNTAGASNAPHRVEQANKFVNTSTAFDQIQAFNPDTGSFDTDSNLSALGTD